MAQTQTTDTAMKVPTGTEIYDALMSEIEPDLLTDVLPTLEKKYAGESPAEKKTRYQRYQAAYKKYDAAFAEWIGSLDKAVDDYRRGAMRSAEAKTQTEEAHQLSQIEAQFQASA